MKFEMYFSMLREYDPEYELKKHITHIANIVGTAIVKALGAKIDGDKMLIDEGPEIKRDKPIGFMPVPGVGTVQILSNLTG